MRAQPGPESLNKAWGTEGQWEIKGLLNHIARGLNSEPEIVGSHLSHLNRREPCNRSL